MIKKKIVLKQEIPDKPYEDFSPHISFPFESNKKCAVSIDCPTHKSANSLIKQLLKDQKDLIKTKAKLKEYKHKDDVLKKQIHEESKHKMKQMEDERPDYNSPG